MFKGFVRENELRRWTLWVGAALLLLVGVALQTSMESVCWDEEMSKAAKINESAGCFDFWFNRYQAFLAALIAFGTAIVAVRPAFSQLREMRRQTAQRSFDYYRSRLSEVGETRDLIIQIGLQEKKIIRAAGALSNAPAVDRMRQAASDFKTSTTDCAHLIEKLNSRASAIWEHDEIRAQRENFISSFKQFCSVAERISPRFNTISDISGAALYHAAIASAEDFGILLRYSPQYRDHSAEYLTSLNLEHEIVRRQIANIQTQAF